MKYILIIGDGMADNPVDILGGKTPLEVARKPHIDAICAKSKLGSVLTVPVNQPPGSDTAILSIFGCDPNQYFTGRSPLEAAGCGISVEPGSISFRCNMITLESGDMPFEQKRILSHNAGIDGEDSIAMITALCEDTEFQRAMEALHMRIEPTPSFRHIAIASQGDIAGFVATPPHNILGSLIGQYRHHGNETANQIWELMRLANQKLEQLPQNLARRQAGKLPANGIWIWAEGTAVQLPSFYKTYHKKGSVISAVPLVHGIGALLGLKPIHVEGATGETETNYEGKVQAAFDCLCDGDDFVCIHIEAPDEATHNGNLEEKLLSISYLDSRVVGPLSEMLEKAKMPYRILLLSDHKTLTATRGHDGDPVPFLIYDSTQEWDSGLSYTEKNGELGPYVPEGTALMDMLFSQSELQSGGV